nr:hypothetical protein [Hymenobacter radiodurans]
MSALDANPKRWQASVQAGAGVTLGRLDLNVRYEWGLSPYKQSFPAPGEFPFLTRRMQQLVLEGGFQLYRRSKSK